MTEIWIRGSERWKKKCINEREVKANVSEIIRKISISERNRKININEGVWKKYKWKTY